MKTTSGPGINLLFTGQHRDAYVYGRVADLVDWMKGMDRPKQTVLVGVVRQLLDLPPAELLRRQNAWRLEKGTEPKVYVIARDQARLYCCLKGADIVILDWARKTQRKASPMVLRRAEQRALEVLNVNG